MNRSLFAPDRVPVLSRETIRSLLRAPKTGRPGWAHNLLEKPTSEKPTAYETLTVANQNIPPGLIQVVCARPWSPKFAIMLWFTDRQDNQYVLRRLDGPGAAHRNRWPHPSHWIFGAHIHCLTEYYLRRQHLPDVAPEGFAVPTRRYGDARGALETVAQIACIESQGELTC